MLLVLEDARGERFGVPAVIDGDSVRRARPGDGVAEALITRLADPSGTRGLSIDVFPPVRALEGERSFDVDQTNDLVVVGEEAVVKWFLHPTEDEQPAPHRMAALARAEFDGTPRPWAAVHLDVDGSRALVATVAEHVPGTRDGWEWAVEEVRAIAKGHGDWVSGFPADVARLVARMHVALAGNGTREASEEQVQSWLRSAVGDLQHAELTPVGAALAMHMLQPIAACAGTVMLDTHGDLHIGQVLRSDVTGRYYVIDFDGNPTLTPSERLLQQPAARDVAGMLASLDHVGRVVLKRTTGQDDEQRGRVLAWIEDAQARFLDAYHLALDRAGRADLLDERLIRPFQLQQECREYAYAARYLPHWRYVPDAALPALLSRGSS
jgi:maltokinase